MTAREVTLDIRTPERGGSRYVVTVDGREAGFAAFEDEDGRRVFTHTEIDEAYAGQGLGGVLIAEALDDVRETGMRAVPACPFVRSYVERHHEYDDIVVS